MTDKKAALRRLHASLTDLLSDTTEWEIITIACRKIQGLEAETYEIAILHGIADEELLEGILSSAHEQVASGRHAQGRSVVSIDPNTGEVDVMVNPGEEEPQAH